MGSKVDTAGTSTLQGRMKKDIPSVRHPELYSMDSTSINKNHLNELLASENALDIMMLTRMLFSCLVDADFLDTEAFMNNHFIGRSPYGGVD